MDISAFKDYITPELLILIPVLYLIGMALKKASWLDDKHIPVALGVFGIVLSALYVVATSTFTDTKTILLAVFTAIVQGILVAGAAVYANNIVKQEKTSG